MTLYKGKRKILPLGERGIALITVLLVVIILELLAVIALNESGYNVVNAGAVKTTEYAFNTSNATINVILPLAISGGAISSLSLNSIDAIQPGYYYYTTNSGLTSSSSPVSLQSGNLLSPSVSQAIIGNPNSGPQIGFEYWIDACFDYQQTTGSVVTDYYYYSGSLDVVSRADSGTKIVETGVSFQYGTFSQWPGQCGSATSFQGTVYNPPNFTNLGSATPELLITSVFQVPR